MQSGCVVVNVTLETKAFKLKDAAAKDTHKGSHQLRQQPKDVLLALPIITDRIQAARGHYSSQHSCATTMAAANGALASLPHISCKPIQILLLLWQQNMTQCSKTGNLLRQR